MVRRQMRRQGRAEKQERGSMCAVPWWQEACRRLQTTNDEAGRWWRRAAHLVLGVERGAELP